MGRPTKGFFFTRKGQYYLRYTHAGTRKCVALGVRTLAEAKAKRESILNPLAALEPHEKALRAAAGVAAAVASRDAAAPKLAVADAWQAYLKGDRPQSGPLTLRDFQRRWERFAAWWSTHAPTRPNVTDVTPADAIAYAQALAEGKAPLGPNRRNKLIATARLVFNHVAAGAPNPFGARAAGQGWLANQALETQGHEPLTAAELAAVLQAATGELRTLLYIGRYTGLRLGDAIQLQWAAVNVHPARPTLTVTPSKTRRRSHSKPIIIDIHPELLAVLTATTPDAREGDVLPALAKAYRHNHTVIARMVRRHFQKCGIATTEDVGTQNRRARKSFHSLRHNVASELAEKGTPQPVAEALLGHASPAIHHVYQKIGPDAARAAIASLGAPRPPAPADTDAARLTRARAWATTAKLSATARRELLAILEG